MIRQPLSLQGKSALVVDDTSEIATLVAEVLGGYGAKVTVANDGADAMEMMQFRHYHLVLLDIMMPPPDGLTVLKFMQSRRPELIRQTVVMTAYCYSKDVQLILTEGQINCLFKPFDLKELYAVAHKIVFQDDPIVAA